jgi:hypothetical protein
VLLCPQQNPLSTPVPKFTAEETLGAGVDDAMSVAIAKYGPPSTG